MLLSTLENILDIPGSVQNTHNFNAASYRSVENDVSAEGKTLNPRSQLLATPSRARLAAEHFHCLVEFVDKGVSIRHAVISNVAPNLCEIFACPRADAGTRSRAGSSWVAFTVMRHASTGVCSLTAESTGTSKSPNRGL